MTADERNREIVSKNIVMVKTSAVSFTNNVEHSQVRFYWLCLWVGWIIGPLLMAIIKPKAIDFGVSRYDGRIKFIEVTWK